VKIFDKFYFSSRGTKKVTPTLKYLSLNPYKFGYGVSGVLNSINLLSGISNNIYDKIGNNTLSSAVISSGILKDKIRILGYLRC
jgi:hypothetical protein